MYLCSSVKRQHESRLRTLDRFEGMIKAAAATQQSWRGRVVLKQGEVDAAKVSACLQARSCSYALAEHDR